jgi:hypothetical protein
MISYTELDEQWGQVTPQLPFWGDVSPLIPLP